MYEISLNGCGIVRGEFREDEVRAGRNESVYDV